MTTPPAPLVSAATPPPLPWSRPDPGETRRRFVELYGSAVLINRYLAAALAVLGITTLALVTLNIRTQAVARSIKPLVIRIDDVGRATALGYDQLAYTPQAPELKYFLVQFVTKHYSRVRATTREHYAQSLYFLDARLASATIEANKKSGELERFLATGTEEVEVVVHSVTLEDLRQSPYKATVDFEKVFYARDTRTELRRQRHIANLVFVLRTEIPNAQIPVNPLGLTITYFRDDQAFQ